MRILNFVLAFIMCVCLTGCSNDEDDVQMSSDALAQTSWEGEYEEVNITTDKEISSNVIVQFLDDKKGQVLYVSGDEKGQVTHFNYSVYGKVVKIWDAGESSYFGITPGIYFLRDFTKNNFVMEARTGAIKATLKLHFQY